ncbi:hypothetical protein [Nocardioides sp. Iso805N]|uniref:hypothetical protein n=1 Tax=Nocardioides sp. Iso805N TaxID=1283287 RepID=UPI00036F5C33|nr:hypothetical protein [Nocardioides sp. Iso805N]
MGDPLGSRSGGNTQQEETSVGTQNTDDESETARLQKVAAQIGFADAEQLVSRAEFEDPDGLLARLRARSAPAVSSDEP